MARSELDEMITRLARSLPHAAESEARRVAQSTVPARLRRGRAPRARWALPALIAGGVLITAGASTAAIAMSHWAQVGMPLEHVRSSEPIPISWTTETGHTEECRVWIEIRNPQSGDRDALDAAISSADWSGLGQRLYDENSPGDEVADGDGEIRVADGLHPIVRSFAEQTFPGIGWLSESTADERTVDAWGMTCVPPTL